MSTSDQQVELYQHWVIVLLRALGIEPTTITQNKDAIRLEDGTLYVDRYVRVMIDGNKGNSTTIETLAIDVTTDATLVAME